MAQGQVSRAFCYYMLQNTRIICDFDAVCRRAQWNCIKTNFTGALGVWMRLCAAHFASEVSWEIRSRVGGLLL